MAMEITQLILEGGWHLQFFRNGLDGISGVATKGEIEIVYDKPKATIWLIASKLADKIDEYEEGNVGLAESEVKDEYKRTT